MAPQPQPPQMAWLIWQQNESGWQTMWVDNQGAVRSRHDGVLGAWEGRLWTVHTADMNVPELNCGCVMENPDALSLTEPPVDCLGDASQAQTVWSSGEVVMNLHHADAADPWLADVTASVSLQGMVGPHLLLSAKRTGYPCGAAHGMTSQVAAVLDVSMPQPVLSPVLSILTPDEREKIASRFMLGELHDTVHTGELVFSASWHAGGPKIWAQYTPAMQPGMTEAPSTDVASIDMPQFLRPHEMALPDPLHGLVPVEMDPLSGSWGFSAMEGTAAELDALWMQLPPPQEP